ncbi:EAL and GGDEF domain-containing protein [Rhodoferax ferrireducens]|uniref:sensor domain-containing protein n=1 Tax=Rhodoferax ferrireducens TaxID=192843 RepID=UPI0018E4F205|nr:EAL domain-containing protein [Rhodoferax ferrireducens]
MSSTSSPFDCQAAPDPAGKPSALNPSGPDRDDGANPWKLALESSGDGVWDWNVVTGEQTHSSRWKEMLGYADDEIGTGYHEFVQRVHPDDLADVQDAARAYLEGRSPGYAVDLRMRCKDGSWKWVLARGMVVSRDAQGQPLRMIGTHTDITERKQTEAALHESHQRFRDLVDCTDGIVWEADAATFVFNYVSGNAERILGYPVTDWLEPGFWADHIDPQDRDQAIQYCVACTGRLEDHNFEYRFITQDGRTVWLRDIVKVVEENGRPRWLRGLMIDITASKQSVATLRENEERWKLALESTGDGVWDWHIPSGEEFFSKRLMEMYGFDESELLNRTEELDERTHPSDRSQMDLDRQAHFDGLTPTYINEHRVRCKDGSWKWVLTRGMVISRDAQGRPLRMTGTHTDITERKKSEALIWQQAHFDALTGLPNRNMLRDRLEQEIKKSKRDGLQLALLFIDLDHFKEVNDTLGHDSGDLLLVEAARRIQRCVRESDTVARMGGDEFTVILTELTDASSLERILQGLLSALKAEFQLGSEQVFVSASIGITMFPLDATDIEDLFKNADQALYVAKGGGRNRFSFFTPALQEAAQTRVRLTNDLRTGLVGQQFRVVYQPIVELATGAVHKAEALIRWLHPTRGTVSPATFIPIAEASGLIVDIGEWVFQQAANQVRQWRQSLAPQFQISVNKSPVQFHHSGRTNQAWFQQLQAMGLPGEAIVVEITEGLLLDSSASVVEQLMELHDAGIQVSLDDFGTGYSSLSYLQKFDIDFIKIDQSFVRHLIADSTDLALCKAIIMMAHELGIKVIAEGVETTLQRDLLAAAGCDYAQGYLFARPMPAPDFEAFMAAR